MATKKKKKTIKIPIPEGTTKPKLKALVRAQLDQLSTDMVSSVSKVVIECEDKGAKGKLSHK
jgi:hypothetical protein